MKDLANYLITSGIYFSVFYLFFLVLLNNDTQYKRNRYYLLFSLCLSLFLPLVSITVDPRSSLSPLLTGIGQVIPVGEITVSPAGNAGSGSEPLSLIAIVYFAGLFLSLLVLAVNLIKLRILIRDGAVNGSRIINTNKKGISGFSAFGYIFIDNSLPEQDLKRITEHERIHLELNHFPDILISRLYSAFFWFNPLVYLFERSLKALHEYQVDARMLDRGEKLTDYQRLILNQLFRTNIFSVQSAFSGKTLIKKRIIMMTKKKSRGVAGLKLLLIVPVAMPLFMIFSCSVYAQGAETSNVAEPLKMEEQAAPPIVIPDQVAVIAPAQKESTRVIPPAELKSSEIAPYKEKINYTDTIKKQDDKKQVFVVVEDMPTFDGGDVTKFRQWVSMNVRYPKEAAMDSIVGKVYLMFVVDEEGKVTNAEIMKGAHPLLDAEALRVVNMSPPWVPGKQRGQIVPVRFSITVNFALK